MAQVKVETQLESPQKRKAGGDGLIDLTDWLKAGEKAEEEAEAQGGAARLAEESPNKKSKNGFSRIEATTIVTGRPTTNNTIGRNDLLSLDEPRLPVVVDLGGKNWVGHLWEYRQAHPLQTGPDYQESSPSLNLFTCLVTIGENPSPLGDLRAIFSRKKDAKQYAAKLAVEWLIENLHMPSNGAVSFPKPRPQQQRPTPKPSPVPGPKSNPFRSASSPSNDVASSSAADTPSFGQRVAELCARLAMSPPTYMITANAEFQAMYSGYAVFENSPVVMGKVGEVSDVYGRKKAKESCAEKVLEVLEGVARDRVARGTAERVVRVERVGSLLD